MGNPFDQFDSGPVYGAPPKVEPYAAEDQSLQREANARAADANARAAEANDRSAREFSATHNPDGSPKPAPKQVQSIPPAAASGLQANLEALRALDASIASLNSRPQSIGPGTGALGDTFTQLNDPGGTDTRSRLGKIGAMTIHDLSGAAVSPTEAPRFQPFVPTVTDTPEVARQKLKNFREALQSQIKEALDYYGPNNGYTPYDTPQAKQFLNGLNTGGGHAGDGAAKRMEPEQQAEFFNILQSQGPDAGNAYLKQFGLSMANPADASKPHSQAVDYSGADAQAQERIKADAAKRGDTGMDAFGEHLANGLTLGAADEIRAAGSALRGESSFSDALQANQGYQNYLSEQHPYASIGGELAGGALSGLALPVAGGPAGVLKQGAAVGGVYGFNSGQDGNRVQSGVMGALAGAALPEIIGAGYGGRALASRNALLAPSEVRAAIPPLVDPATGELNQPMDAMRPADRVQSMHDYGMKTVTPGMAGGRSARIMEQGLNNLPGSAGLMEDVNSAASSELRRSMQGVAQQFGSSKTLNEGGAAIQSAALARNDRAEGVISKAYNAIPIADTAPASRASTIATLQRLTGRFQSNSELAQAMHDPQLAKYRSAFEGGDISWADLKDFRSAIGEKIGDMRFGEKSSTSDLRALYAALSEDMRATASQQGPRALRTFERANGLHRENEQLIENSLTRILGKDGQMKPEQAADAIRAMTQGGKRGGDIKTLAQVRSATVKSGAWDEIASTLIHLGGQPSNSEGRAFQPATFVNWYADMSEPARGMLFKPELRKALDGFVAMNQQFSRLKGLNNTSGTTPTIIGSSAMGGAGVATAMGHPVALLGIIGGGLANLGMAKLWTSPKFVSLITGYGRALATGNQNAVKSQIGRLGKLASTNPELREPLIALQQKLLSGANDNAMMGAAASQTNSEEQ